MFFCLVLCFSWEALRKLALEMRSLKIMTWWGGWRPSHSGNLEHYVMLAPPPPPPIAASELRSRRRPPLNPIGWAGVSCWGPDRGERETLLNKSCCRVHFNVVPFGKARERPTSSRETVSRARPVVLLLPRLATYPPRGRCRSRKTVRIVSSTRAADAPHPSSIPPGATLAADVRKYDLKTRRRIFKN